MNSYWRIRGLLVGKNELDSLYIAGLTPAIGGVEFKMHKPIPRRKRGPSCTTSNRMIKHQISVECTADRLKEGCQVNQRIADTEIRSDLVARIRQEILIGTYDTPDKLEAALSRLAERLDRE